MAGIFSWQGLRKFKDLTKLRQFSPTGRLLPAEGPIRIGKGEAALIKIYDGIVIIVRV